MRGFSSKRILAAWVPAALLVGIALDAHATQPYRLDPPSNYQQGCFEPCMCPILMFEGVRGTFATTPLGTDDGFEVFRVRNLRWVLPGAPPRQVRGSGTYRIDRQAEEQRMELDLFVGNDPVQHFDSGIVPAGDVFPDIDVVVSIHGMFCYDVVFELRARALDIDPRKWPDELDPQAPRGPKELRTWSLVKSLYRD